MILLSNRAEIQHNGQLTLSEKLAEDPTTVKCYRWKKGQVELLKLDDAKRQLSESQKPILFVVHGFDQTLDKTIERSQLLADIYPVEVVVFTWPSHPAVSPFSGYLDKFIRYVSNRGRSRAKRSAHALLHAFKEGKKLLGGHNTSVSLLVHSMGNLVLERALRAETPDLSFFSNVILHQAEVKSLNHHLWVEQMQHERAWVTINRNDHALRATEKFKKPRLGSSTPSREAKGARYIDFTDQAGVGDSHIPWMLGEDDVKIQALFTALFSGKTPSKEVALTEASGQTAV